MKSYELKHISAAVIILFIVIGLSSILGVDSFSLPILLLYAFIIIATNIFAKKITARALDADVEHKLWGVSRYGFKKHQHFKKEAPAGIIIPLLFSFITLGSLKVMSLLTYESRALKTRAAKRFGYYSYTEMTDFHNAIIGAAGILAVLTLSFVAYFIPTLNLEYLSQMSAYYAFFNLLPISKLDGAQIFFGSRTLYTALAIITLIFSLYALILI